MRCGPSLADFLGGAHLALGVMAALRERDRTGLGQLIEVSLQDAVIPALSSNISGWLTDPENAPERTGNHHGGMREAPYNVYATSDGWVAILCISEPHWRALSRLIGRLDLLEDPGLASSTGRVARIAEIDGAVSAWTAQHTSAEVAGLLQQVGVPASPVRTVANLVAEELARPAPMINRIQTSAGDYSYTLGSPVRLANHPARPPGPAPSLGEHTDAVFSDFAPVTGGASDGD